jgi:hypothetical protein
MSKPFVILTEDEFHDTDEIYTDFFRCPNCECEDIIRGFNYCPLCGIAIDWQVDYKKLDEVKQERDRKLFEDYKMRAWDKIPTNINITKNQYDYGFIPTFWENRQL